MIIPIHLPINSKCIIKSGNVVDFQTSIFEEKIDVDISIPLSKLLGVHEKKIFHYLKKFVGESVKKGEVIAVKKAFLSTNTVISEHDGILREVNHDKGCVILTTSNSTNQTRKAFFKGTAIEIKNNILFLKVKEGKSFPLQYASESFGGEVQILKTSSDLTAPSISNKIIIAKTLVSYEIIKAEALGCKGIVSVTYKLSEKSIPTAQLKHEEDYKKICEAHFPYCLISKEENIIYIYK
jgi:hypothetical protein